MSRVRFAMVCDICHERQEEYGGVTSCDDCGRDVCEKCAAKFDIDADYEDGAYHFCGSVVCHGCAWERIGVTA